MSNQYLQDPNPRLEVSKFLPSKKGAMAEKSLVRYIKAPESESKSESSDMSDDGEDFDAQKLKELQLDAFYSLLQAFTAETTRNTFLDNSAFFIVKSDFIRFLMRVLLVSCVFQKDTSIIERLMEEWNISLETLNSYVNHIQKNLLAQQQQQRVISPASNEKEVEIEEEYPLTKSEKKTSLNQTSVVTSSWGSLKPETLVGKSVRVRMPGEDDLEEFIIKEYDSKQEMHRLAPADPDAMEMGDVLSWIDIRRIPHRDIVWERELRPKYDAPNQSSTRGAFF